MKRTLTTDELIQEIAENLRGSKDGDYIADIANKVLPSIVTYKDDETFEVEDQ